MFLQVRAKPCLRLLSVAALAIGFQAVRPADAQASCGDWLAGHGHAKSPAAETQAHAATRFDSLEHGALPAPAPNDPPPCHGPSCRRAPEAPPPTVPPRTQTDSEDRWVSLAGQALAQPAGVLRLALEETLELSAGLRPRVERPPRV